MKSKAKNVKVKEGKVFSFALFKQSLKAQKTIWLATTLGNALVVGIIIAILSTLTINTTRDGLSNLFDTASLEHTVKSSAAQAYMGYELVTDEYYNDLETLAEATPTLYETDKKIMSGYDTIVYDSISIAGNKLNYGEAIKTIYNASSGSTHEEKVNSTKNTLSAALNNVSNLDDQTKTIVIDYFLDPYLDRYYYQGVNNVSSLCIYAFPIAVKNYINNDASMESYKPYADKAGDMVNDTLIQYAPGERNLDGSREEDRSDIAYDKTYEVITSVLPDSIDTSTVKTAYSVIMNGATDEYEIKSSKKNGKFSSISGYLQDSSGYEVNKPYLKAYAVIKASSSMTSSLAKWEYLDAFEVKYITNEAGIPVDKDGNEIFDSRKYNSISADYVPCDSDGNELKINDELLDKRVPVKENMGTNSDNLQKKYRALLDPRISYQLNGKSVDDYQDQKDKDRVTNKYVGYTVNEIKKAEEDLNNADLSSQSGLLLADFLKKTIKDDKENTSIYYNKTTKQMNKDNMIESVSEYLTIQAEDTIKKQFNVESINDLTKENAGISGQEMIDKVSEYTASAISQYNSAFNKYKKIYVTDSSGNYLKDDDGNLIRKYSDSLAQEMAIVNAGIGLTDQLPTYIKDSLTEMGQMNTYGLVVGLIFFDCAGLLLPIIYLMMSANDLVAGQVDSGSLAFVLSTPTKRSKFTFTQVVYLFGSLTVSYLIIFLISLIVRHLGILLGSQDLVTDLTDLQLLLYTIGGYAVSFAIAGICFLSSCVFNKSKTSLGVGMGLSMFFLVTSIIGIFGSPAMPSTIRIEAMDIFNYVTIVRLFDVNAILAENYSMYWYKLIALFVIGIATTIAGSIYFERKDLPL